MHSIWYRDAILIVYMRLKKSLAIWIGCLEVERLNYRRHWTYLVFSIFCLTQAVTPTKVHRCRI